MYRRVERGWLKHLDFIICDIVSLHISFILAYWLRHGFRNPYRDSQYLLLIAFYTILNFFIPSIFSTMHGVLNRGYYQEFIQTLRHVLLELAGMAIYMFALQSGGTYSRTVVALTAVFHLVTAYALRLIWKIVLVKIAFKRKERFVLLVCERYNAERIITQIEEHESDRLQIIGLILTDVNAKGEYIGGYEVLENLDNAASYIVRKAVDEVFFTVDRNSELPHKLVDQCREMGVTIHLILPMQKELGERAFPEMIAGMLVLTNSKSSGTSFELFVKRVIDILGGLVGSLIALIIIAIVGPKIKKASPGPILYKQERIGRNGRKFKIYKIRSMYPDADKRKAELMAKNRVSDGMMFKLDFDPRIIGNELLPDGTHKTGIGEFIRRTSLDEFPQFFNILKNEMSLVGTRPPTVDEWERYELRHRSRLSIKPGLTGMWQVSGRSNITDFEEVVRLDTQYIENWSIGLDIKILLKTVMVVFGKRGAM